MKLIDKTEWYARVYADLKITKDLDEKDDFPFDIGAVVITSKDGKRNFVLDSYSTNYTKKLLAGETFEFNSKLEIDQEIFPVDKEYNYELTLEDLSDCTATFYLNRDPDFFDVPDIKCILFFGSEEIVVKCQLED